MTQNGKKPMKNGYNFGSKRLSFLLILLFLSSFPLQSLGLPPTIIPPATKDLVAYSRQSNFIKEIAVPVQELGLRGITTDSQGNVWIYHSTNMTSTIFMFDQEKQTFSRYPVEGETTADNAVINLAAGHLAFDNRTNTVWFTDARTNSIGRLDATTGYMQLASIPTPDAGPMGITLEPDGKSAWFTEITGDKIAKIDVSSMKITEFETGENSGPAVLSFDNRGILWISLSFSNAVLRVDPGVLSSSSNPSTAMTEFRLSGEDAFSPFGIAVSDNKVYVSDHSSSRVIVSDAGFVNYDSYWTSPAEEFPTTLPGEVATDRQGNVYFPQHGGNRLSVIDKGGVMTEYEIPTGPLSTTLFLAASNDGKVWFGEWASNKIAYLDTNVKMPFDIQVEGASGGVVLGNDRPESIDVLLKKDPSSINSSSVSLSEVGIAVIGMTESGLDGVTYDSQPQSVSLEQVQEANIKVDLTAEEGATPGKYTLMVRASAIEKDGLLVSELYPVSVTLDVPVPAGQENDNPSTGAPDEAQDFSYLLRDMLRILAITAAVGLIGYLVYKRVKKRSDTATA